MDETPPEPVEPPDPHFDSSDTVGLPATPTDGGGSGGGCGVPRRVGDFMILRVLGEGGMGTVFLAEDIRLGRKAAIKTMKQIPSAKPEDRQRFAREARAAAAVEHDNIVPIWQVGEASDGSPFIAMPFLRGETLEERLRRGPVTPVGLVLKVAGEVAEGLSAAHDRGLIHRDIKPSNVWLEGDPDAEDPARQVRPCKILDFGLARTAGDEGVQLTGWGVVLGTPAYMAPEQARGEGVDHRADLFSLGVLLYRMSTGESPFGGTSVIAVLTALATATPTPARTRNRDLPRELSDLIGRLMCKDPAGRPRSAGDVAVAVRQIERDWRAGRPDPAGDPTPRSKARRSGTPSRVGLALLALAALGGWLAAVALRGGADKGGLVVEVDDAGVEARLEGVRLVLTGPGGEARYTLAPGERDKEIDAGPYEIRVEGADGLKLDPPAFTLEKGGRVTVRVTLGPEAVARGIDADRRAAEYVLSIGGTVRVDAGRRDIGAARDLPKGPFGLTWVELHENARASDAGLAAFEGCKGLRGLALDRTMVTDAGLSHFRGCTGLTSLDLEATRVTDAGLAHFGHCKGLTSLSLNYTKVGDAGLARFEHCKGLTRLGLDQTRVTDAGLAHFGHCKGLPRLDLEATRVGDAGLAHFGDCKGLTRLDLRGTKVGDAGLARFEDCKEMRLLRLQKTGVTAAMVEGLRKALPKCRVEWDGGVGPNGK